MVGQVSVNLPRPVPARGSDISRECKTEKASSFCLRLGNTFSIELWTLAMLLPMTWDCTSLEGLGCSFSIMDSIV